MPLYHIGVHGYGVRNGEESVSLGWFNGRDSMRRILVAVKHYRGFDSWISFMYPNIVLKNKNIYYDIYIYTYNAIIYIYIYIYIVIHIYIYTYI